MKSISIAPYIYAALTQHEALADIVGDCIHDTVATHGVDKFPYVLFRCQLARVDYDTEHTVIEDTHTIDVQCVSQKGMLQTYDIAACVRDALEGYCITANYIIDNIDVNGTESAYDLNYQAFVTTVHLTATCQPNYNV